MSTKITKANIESIRMELEAAIKAVADKHGLTSKIGRIVYTETSIKAEVTAVAVGEDQDSVDPAYIAEINRYAELARLVGVPVIHVSSGIKGKIVGCKPRTGGKGLIVKSEQGQLYRVDYFKDLHKTWKLQ